MRPFEPPASFQVSAWGRFSAALIACCGLLVSAASAAPAVTVKDVRLWAGPETTRIVLDLSGPASHAVTILQHPDRVVVDISSARLEHGRKALPAGQGLAKQLRSGRQGDALRLVVDLAGQATPHVFDVAPQGDLGHRLVVDLVAPPSSATATASTGCASNGPNGAIDAANSSSSRAREHAWLDSVPPCAQRGEVAR